MGGKIDEQNALFHKRKRVRQRHAKRAFAESADGGHKRDNFRQGLFFLLPKLAFIIVHLSLHFVKILQAFFLFGTKNDFEANFLFFLRFPLKNAENYCIMTEITFFRFVKISL